MISKTIIILSDVTNKISFVSKREPQFSERSVWNRCNCNCGGMYSFSYEISGNSGHLGAVGANNVWKYTYTSLWTILDWMDALKCECADG